MASAPWRRSTRRTASRTASTVCRERSCLGCRRVAALSLAFMDSSCPQILAPTECSQRQSRAHKVKGGWPLPRCATRRLGTRARCCGRPACPNRARTRIGPARRGCRGAAPACSGRRWFAAPTRPQGAQRSRMASGSRMAQGDRASRARRCIRRRQGRARRLRCDAFLSSLERRAYGHSDTRRRPRTLPEIPSSSCPRAPSSRAKACPPTHRISGPQPRWMDMPPSTSSAVPVVNDDASEAR